MSIAEGKGGRQRLIPVSGRFFAAVAAYLDAERPADAGTDRVFVVLKGPRRGQPLSAKGTDEVLTAARRRAGLDHATWHELRHTCLTRLREAGMALEAVQAQAGHASIESTRIYLHLADDWLAAQYRKAAEVIDAQVDLLVAVRSCRADLGRSPARPWQRCTRRSPTEPDRACVHPQYAVQCCVAADMAENAGTLCIGHVPLGLESKVKQVTNQ